MPHESIYLRWPIAATNMIEYGRAAEQGNASPLGAIFPQGINFAVSVIWTRRLFDNRGGSAMARVTQVVESMGRAPALQARFIELMDEKFRQPPHFVPLDCANIFKSAAGEPNLEYEFLESFPDFYGNAGLIPRVVACLRDDNIYLFYLNHYGGEEQVWHIVTIHYRENGVTRVMDGHMGEVQVGANELHHYLETITHRYSIEHLNVYTITELPALRP